MHKTGTIYGINGPVIYLKGNTGFQMAEMVYVGKERLVGEVIRLTNDITLIFFRLVIIYETRKNIDIQIQLCRTL